MIKIIIIIILLVSLILLTLENMAMRKKFINTHDIYHKVVSYLHDLSIYYNVNWDDSESIDSVLDELAMKVKVSRSKV